MSEFQFFGDWEDETIAKDGCALFLSFRPPNHRADFFIIMKEKVKK
ncbi:hypothetical protein [Bacillus sp. FJAT-50079]|nr:hypothetical protein [Bacillus sp. FJAT-50079]MBS4209865.1 hypothetical protein [Bacillus sp. FJAT-50079]